MSTVDNLFCYFIQKPNMGLGMILDSAVGMFPHKIGPLLQLLTALLSNKSTVKKVDLTHAQTYTRSTFYSTFHSTFTSM